jgi:FkbM family methyltransferase
MLAIEPRQAAQAALEKTSKELGSFSIAQVALAESERFTSFNEHGAQSSILNSNNGTRFGRTGEVKTTTLDLLLERMDLGFPDFIKLDLQGAELLCLEGAQKCLDKAVFIQLELSFIQLYEKSPLFDEVVAYMKQRGFICSDILGLWHRPLDGALAQGDFLFIRETHPLRSDKRWSDESTWCG